MIQANLRESDNVSRDGWVYGARFRTILVKREMGSGLVMILKIRRQNPAQLALIEDDDVIETFAEVSIVAKAAGVSDLVDWLACAE
jgi:hypothetical protein